MATLHRSVKLSGMVLRFYARRAGGRKETAETAAITIITVQWIECGLLVLCLLMPVDVEVMYLFSKMFGDEVKSATLQTSTRHKSLWMSARALG